MSRFPRSPGSALKPFIYALAFEQGLAHPETRLFDRPMRYGAYAPQNFNLGYEGAVTARKALQMSLNLPAVELLSDVGPATFLARLHSAGADNRSAEGYAGRPRHRTWRARRFAHRHRPALCRLRPRRRGPAAGRAARRPAPGHRPAPGDRSGRGLLHRRHPARRAAARQRAQRPDRLQDRHILRLSRRARDRLRPADDDRGLGRAARQWPDGRPDRARGGRADPVRRVRAAGPRASSPSGRRRACSRLRSPPICPRPCDACARTRAG